MHQPRQPQQRIGGRIAGELRQECHSVCCPERTGTSQPSLEARSRACRLAFSPTPKRPSTSISADDGVGLPVRRANSPRIVVSIPRTPPAPAAYRRDGVSLSRHASSNGEPGTMPEPTTGFYPPAGRRLILCNKHLRNKRANVEIHGSSPAKDRGESPRRCPRQPYSSQHLPCMKFYKLLTVRIS
jgi:hypothetical protein